MKPLEVFFEIHTDLERESPGRDRYTRQAFQMLPRMARPRILDIGCGPGAATMELARLINGEVTALDFHQPFLDRLNVKIEEAGLSGRVRAVNGSMFEMDFLEESFDIIWAEGSIYIIGFDRGLREWQRWLKPEGYLVVTEVAWLRPDPPQEVRDFWEANYPAIRTIPENLQQISASGYRLVGYFTLPEDAWWVGYYIHVEKRLQGLRKKYNDDPEALAVIDEEQREIDMYRNYSEWYGSVFFVMQKDGPEPAIRP
jgi:ubiquinone/menaquinone biosynthesis C-methylase UbiE